MTLCFEIQTSKFIQIIHDGHGHWLTISSIGVRDETEIFIYDSMYPSLGTYSKEQVAALLASNEEKVHIRMMDVQQQVGGCDCGLYAIAFPLP